MNLAGQEKSLKILNEKAPEVKKIPLGYPSDNVSYSKPGAPVSGIHLQAISNSTQYSRGSPRLAITCVLLEGGESVS